MKYKLFTLIITAMTMARHRAAEGESIVRRWLPVTVVTLAFFGICTAALGYIQPLRERRAATAMPAGAGEDEHALGDGLSTALTISKESQLMFGIRTIPVSEQRIVSGLKVTGAVVTPPNAKSKISPPVAGRLTLDPRLTVGSMLARGQRIGTIEQVLSAPEISSLEAAACEE